MKSLDQIEARTPISSAPYNITQPGTYYLTTNLTVTTATNGITVTVNNVTLDLNGFAISSTSPANSGAGVLLDGPNSDITIYNGHIQGGVTNNGANFYNGPGFASGLSFSGVVPQNVQVRNVTVTGTANSGIYLGATNSTSVENCQVRTVGNYGIWAATVKSSVALDCGGTAITGDNVSDSGGQSTVNGDGIFANYTVQNSFGWATNGLWAIDAEGTAENCYGSTVGGIGIFATVGINCFGIDSGNGYGLNGGHFENCNGSDNGNGFGISASTAQNCVGSASGVGTGISVYGAMNCTGFTGTSFPVSGTGAIGISCTVAQNCHGECDAPGGIGLHATRVAIGCDGQSSGALGIALQCDGTAESCSGYDSGGTAIKAVIGIGCVKFSGTNNISGAYLGTVSP